MSRFEAKLDGDVELGESFTEYNEVQVFKDMLTDLGLQPNLGAEGRGGYYQFNVKINGKDTLLHIYLKKLSFGGRESRPYEKRAQFSAALDRRGYDAKESKNEHKLILATYKRKEFSELALCAWNINDWGYNIGRAFNCFTDVRSVADALNRGFARYESSAGQVTCSFIPEKLLYYIQHKESLHKEEELPKDAFINTGTKSVKGKKINVETADISKEIDIPKFDDLFQHMLDVLRDYVRPVSLDEIEYKIIDRLQLPYDVWSQVHNQNEGNRTTLGYRLAWARFYLKKAGLIESPERGLWCLTALGKNTITVDKEKIKKIATEREMNAETEKNDLDAIKNEIVTDEHAADVEAEDQESFSEIEVPFDPNKVDIKTKPMSLDLILKRLHRGEIDMDASFQRKAGLWNITKQSRLIESILIKLPLPAFYFDGTDDDKWLVVDGLQRVSSLDNFINKKSFALHKLEFLSQFNGKKFHELPGNLQRRIEEFEITAYIIPPGTPKDLKYNVFKRINTGGLTLTPQEIKNAIYNGVPSNFVKELADLQSFKLATGSSIPEDRMMDREFVTRFLAFYVFTLEDYKSDLDFFLNSALNKLYQLPKNEMEKIEADFNKAMKTAFNLFGEDAFRKRYHTTDKRKPINKALFEVWSVLLSQLSTPQTNKIIQNKEKLKSKLLSLFQNDGDFNLAISSSTGDKSRVKKRFAEIEKIINSVTH